MTNKVGLISCINNKLSSWKEWESYKMVDGTEMDIVVDADKS